MHGLRHLHPVLLATALFAVTCCGALFPGSALASEPSRPAIESMSSGIGGEITVGAHINPEGLDTAYELKVECRGSGTTCEPLSNPPRGAGMLPANFTGQEVSLNVTSLEPGTYWFSVLAQNSLGVAYRRSNILDIPPPPPGACPTGCSSGEPYKPEIPPWVGKAAAEQAAQAVAEYQAKQRQAAKEQEEQQARAAALRSAEEAAFRQREAEEQEGIEPTTHAEQKCNVPALRGLTLSAARQALSKAHCRLGRISRPTRHQSVLVIVEQSPRHGKRLPARAEVSVKLLAAHHRSG